jgi:hypothetical protein
MLLSATVRTGHDRDRIRYDQPVIRCPDAGGFSHSPGKAKRQNLKKPRTTPPVAYSETTCKPRIAGATSRRIPTLERSANRDALVHDLRGDVDVPSHSGR